MEPLEDIIILRKFSEITAEKPWQHYSLQILTRLSELHGGAEPTVSLTVQSNPRRILKMSFVHPLQTFYEAADELYSDAFKQGHLSRQAYENRHSHLYKRSSEFLKFKKDKLQQLYQKYVKKGLPDPDKFLDFTDDDSYLLKITPKHIEENDWTMTDLTKKFDQAKIGKRKSDLKKQSDPFLRVFKKTSDEGAFGGGASLQKLPGDDESLASTDAPLVASPLPLSKTGPSYAEALGPTPEGGGLSKLSSSLDRTVIKAEFRSVENIIGVPVLTKQIREETWKPLVNEVITRLRSTGYQPNERERFHDLEIIQADFFQRVGYQDNYYAQTGRATDDKHMIRLDILYNIFSDKSVSDKELAVLQRMEQCRSRLLQLRQTGGGAL